jgi:hypothetical protein
MRVVVCTLFEKQYHLGVAVLVNSLARAGFRGTVVAGFRGPLPAWAADARQQDATTWELAIPNGPTLVFTRLETTSHFTNFKPAFMRGVLDRPDADGLFYFDPDIVVNTTWHYLEEWLTCGIAVCDDVNSPAEENHPLRVGWWRFFAGSDIKLHYRGSRYANGGVVGIVREQRDFLELWQHMLDEVTASLGGADVVGIEGGRMLDDPYGFANCFRHTDQDVLNAALEASPHHPVSFLGRQAMGFMPGTPILPHALGPRKPWSRRFILEALGGRPPARVDRAFWAKADGPLKPFSAVQLAGARVRVSIAAALGRFIRRS